MGNSLQRQQEILPYLYRDVRQAPALCMGIDGVSRRMTPGIGLVVAYVDRCVRPEGLKQRGSYTRIRIPQDTNMPGTGSAAQGRGKAVNGHQGGQCRQPGEAARYSSMIGLVQRSSPGVSLFAGEAAIAGYDHPVADFGKC